MTVTKKIKDLNVFGHQLPRRMSFGRGDYSSPPVTTLVVGRESEGCPHAWTRNLFGPGQRCRLCDEIR